MQKLTKLSVFLKCGLVEDLVKSRKLSPETTDKGKGIRKFVILIKDIKNKFIHSFKIIPNLTFAHRLAVIPVGIAGVDTLNRARTLLHDKAWGAGEGNSGAQLICDVTAAEISMGHVGLPAVFIIES